jgi:hypothetical protein
VSGILPLVAALVACGVLLTGGVPSASGSDELERIREKTGEMLVAVNGARYASFGDGKDSELEKAYGGFAYLLTPDKLEKVAELVNEIEDGEIKEARLRTLSLLRYHALMSRTASIIDNYRNSCRDRSMQVDGQNITLRGLDFRMGREESQDARRKWWLASSQLYKGVNVYLGSFLHDLNVEAKALGYPGYYALLREAQRWDLELLTRNAETTLRNSEKIYSSLLERWADQEMGLKVRKIRSYDAERLFFFPSLSERVALKKPLDLATATLKEFGLDLGKQRTLRVDVRDRKGRSPEAHAYQISTGKTHLTMIPSGYFTDIQDLLGALGEAEFYHSIPGEQPFEHAYFGTNVIPSVYRGLLELIAEEPQWIATQLKPKKASVEEVAEAFRFRRIMKMREAAGFFLFQLQLQEDPTIEPSVYAEQMESALLWKQTANDADAYLSKNDDYRSGGRLLGYVIAVKIRDALRDEWGAEWFRNEELNQRLRRGAERGYDMELDEFLGIWNLTELDANLLSQEPEQG